MADNKLGAAVHEAFGLSCVCNELTNELFRGLRFHFAKLIKKLKEGDLEKAQLGLGHSYSRAKVKFNVNRADNMVIQAISMLDQLDKDLNTFSMRCREWYSWHFPELAKIVTDHVIFARLAVFIKNKSELSEEHLEKLAEITMDSGKAREILDAARASMGTDTVEIDMTSIETFAQRVISLAEYRKSLHQYLTHKMETIAPNLAALIGEFVGARLIAHAGSLTNLSKCPASTLQILGAEKALFRALKTRGKTPKYGLIFHSTYIGRAAAQNKGRISRFLANKCSIASRIDCFSEKSTSLFGKALKEQVEERLRFYESGTKPRKNLDVVEDVMKQLKSVEGSAKKKRKTEDETTPSKAQKPDSVKKTKHAVAAESDEQPKVKKPKPSEDAVSTPNSGKKKSKDKTPKSSKKSKKSKSSESDSD